MCVRAGVGALVMAELSSSLHTYQALHFVPTVNTLVFKVCSFSLLLPVYLGWWVVYLFAVDDCLFAMHLSVCVRVCTCVHAFGI